MTTEEMPPISEETPEKNDKRINLLEVDITDDIVALNVLVGFIGVAQRRGVFAINESAKIHECIEKFQRAPIEEETPPVPPTPPRLERQESNLN